MHATQELRRSCARRCPRNPPRVCIEPVAELARGLPSFPSRRSPGMVSRRVPRRLASAAHPARRPLLRGTARLARCVPARCRAPIGRKRVGIAALLASPVGGARPIGPPRPARRHTNKRPCAGRGGLLLPHMLPYKQKKTHILWAFLG